MGALMNLCSDRIFLRQWRDEDREAFAAMNSDARVMEFFRSPLNRIQSELFSTVSAAKKAGDRALADLFEKHLIS